MMSAKDLIAALERAPGIVIPLVRQRRPEDWSRTARHDEYNSYSVFTMFRHLALHDFFHAYRIEELPLRKDWPAPAFMPEAG
jgi:hypothetical protein